MYLLNSLFCWLILSAYVIQSFFMSVMISLADFLFFSALLFDLFLVFSSSFLLIFLFLAYYVLSHSLQLCLVIVSHMRSVHGFHYMICNVMDFHPKFRGRPHHRVGTIRTVTNDYMFGSLFF